ncbi:Fic family protein [Tessaracoccus lapidicaptus]|uniref:Fic family protein n=1 Tax=Tessaracoccus lapidicaptus TaxID=1427523 RepID=UPI00333FC46D
MENGDAWPGVGYIEATWHADDPAASRRQRALNRGTFRFALPAVIGDLEPRVDPALAGEADQVCADIRAFDAESASWGVPFASVLLRTESASSSQIENLTAGARAIALASLGGRTGANAVMIAANTDAMRAAIELADRISPNTIRAMHERLNGGDDPANAGRFRDQSVWVGGRSPVTATFVAPPHHQVESAIDDLCEFARRTDLQPMVQAAVAHAQFETIHPFTDGNGRTGRALVSSILRHRGVSPRMTVPISSGLLADTGEYFAALTAYRRGDLVPIVEAFVEASRRAMENANILRSDINDLRDRILATADRRTANLMKVADLCSAEPALTAEMVADLGVPVPSVYRILDRLAATGVLRVEKPIGGVRVWTVPGLLSALDRFAERAGRRTFSSG